MIGVLKAYSTRVGGGPFPTEQDNAIGQHIRDRGNEYGTVTRRPRRCGWFDAVAARYTARLSGVDSLAIMLLDVLSDQEEIRICTAYEIDGRRITQFPSHVDDLRRAKPIYESHPGWREEISGIRRMSDLPANARAYLAAVGRDRWRAGGSRLGRAGSRADDFHALRRRARRGDVGYAVRTNGWRQGVGSLFRPSSNDNRKTEGRKRLPTPS